MAEGMHRMLNNWPFCLPYHDYECMKCAMKINNYYNERPGNLFSIER